MPGSFSAFEAMSAFWYFYLHFYSRLFARAQTLSCNSIRIDGVEASERPRAGSN
jgi:hypothetical protein